MSEPRQLALCSDCGVQIEDPYTHTWRVSINGQNQGDVHFYLCPACREGWSFGSANAGVNDGLGNHVVIEQVTPGQT
jgi:hypothetical protein